MPNTKPTTNSELAQQQRDSFKAKLPKNAQIPLKPQAGLAASHHYFEPHVVDAIITAYNIQRPLLVRGEPGLGKSQIAHAIAQCQGWNLLLHVVHSRTEPTDLLYRVDHVKRLATAQLQGAFASHFVSDAGHASDYPSDYPSAYQHMLNAVNEANFVVPGVLWWAYNATSARRFYMHEADDDMAATSEPQSVFAQADHGYQSALLDEIAVEQPSVILIDEIDKADAELPNALLEVLNNRSFHVPTEDKCINVDSNKPPFVVITSNDERPLPHAFLRRCVVLNLTLTDQQQLIQVAQAHQSELSGLSDAVITRAAEHTMQCRKRIADGEYKPGTSEFLDLLKALHRGYQDEAKQRETQQLEEQQLEAKQREARQLEAIDIISDYLLKK